MNSNFRMIVAGGGSGGHFFPALAICKSLRSQGVKVKYMGSRYGIESNYFNFTDSPKSEKQLKLASTPKGLLAFIEKLSTQKTLIMQYENDYATYNYKFDIDGSPHIVIKSSE